MPKGTQLSRRSICFVNIEAVDEAAEAAEKAAHEKMLEYFMNERDVTWGQ